MDITFFWMWKKTYINKSNDIKYGSQFNFNIY